MVVAAVGEVVDSEVEIIAAGVAAVLATEAEAARAAGGACSDSTAPSRADATRLHTIPF